MRKKDYMNKCLSELYAEVDASIANSISHAVGERIAELEAEMRELRAVARVLLDNAEGCAMNHYGEDYHLHGEPGWLRDSREKIEKAEHYQTNSGCGGVDRI